MEELKFSGKDYWKNYMDLWFGNELIEEWDNNVQIDKIVSNNKEINLELYIRDKTAPTIVFSHGIAGYARVLLPFIIPLFKIGYNFVVPDLQGYGYNTGIKGDFEWNLHVQNLVDSVKYAKENFKGNIYLGGASMGGPLAYSASCMVPDLIEGLITWCLWDFSDREFMLNETTTGKFTYFLKPLFKLCATLFGNTRVKTYHLVSYDTLTCSEYFNSILKKDPQAGTHITLKGALSLLLQSVPLIDHRMFELPTLVLQPKDDRMTPPKYIERTYNKLGSKIKKYVEVENCEHFPIHSEHYNIWAEEVDCFIKRLEDIR